MPELTQEELALLTAATYERARQDWLKKARVAKRPRGKAVARGKTMKRDAARRRLAK